VSTASAFAWMASEALLVAESLAEMALSALGTPRYRRATMQTPLVFAALAVLVGAVAWRPHGWGPVLGAALAVALAALGGAVGPDDVVAALASQWRAYATLVSVMATTSCAERLGLLDRLAALIEPRTRGPVKHAFRVTFVIAALLAAVLSNDAAILLLTPTILTLLRAVYPRRYPKFLVPFALAVFAAAGVAPLVISNPMNLVVAEHLDIGFNDYALRMIPVAVVGWVTTYAVLAWSFRDALSDEAPALGSWPRPPGRPSIAERIVLYTGVASLVAYPLAALADLPLWPIAATGALISIGATLRAGHPGRTIARGVAWPAFPFLTGVFVLAVGLERVGVVAWLVQLYGSSDHPQAVVGLTSAIGSAILNNHPMSVLNVFALEALPDGRKHAFAALVGGDLGPRLLPVGSLASLLWFDVLRKHGVDVPVKTFIRVGVLLTVPTLTLSLATLAALQALLD
jgi:arsenical pump membrane protein